MLSRTDSTPAPRKVLEVTKETDRRTRRADSPCGGQGTATAGGGRRDGGSGPSAERGEAGGGRKEGGPRPLTTPRPGRAEQVKRPSSGLGRRHAPRPTPGHSSPQPSRPPDPSSASSPGKRRSRSGDPHPELVAASPHVPAASGATGEGRGKGEGRQGRSPTRCSRAAAAAAIPSLRSSARPHGRTSP